MGYSLSRHSVIRNLPQLRQLAELKTTVRFSTTDPKKLAYKLREALAACAAHEEFIELYEHIQPHYRFREGEREVIAEYFSISIGEVERDSPNRVVIEKKTIPGVSGLADILATAIKFGNEEELYFPNGSLDDDAKMKLYTWCSPLEWSYIDHTHGGGEGLTLTKKELPEGVAWSASEEVSS
jgi:hypothetical protein